MGFARRLQWLIWFRGGIVQCFVVVQDFRPRRVWYSTRYDCDPPQCVYKRGTYTTPGALTGRPAAPSALRMSKEQSVLATVRRCLPVPVLTLVASSSWAAG